MTENKVAKMNDVQNNKVTVKADVQFSDFRNVEQMLEFGATLVKSKLTPLTTPEAVMAAILAGKELGFGVMASVNNIYPINGRATSGVHIINALILKAGVTYQVIEDYTPLYSFIDKNKVTYNDDEVSKRKDLFQIVTTDTPKEAYDTTKTAVVRGTRPADFRTTVEFTRKVRQADGEWTAIKLIVSRTLKDFTHLLSKDNWINNSKGMLFNRVLAIGSRAIADDITLGLFLTEEITDENTVPIKSEPITEAATVVVI